MTPPGDSLEFNEAAFFTARTKTAPAVNDAVRSAIRNNPQIGSSVAGPAREFSLTVGASRYIVFYVRSGNNLGLTAIYQDTANEKANIEGRRQLLKDLFKKGDHR